MGDDDIVERLRNEYPPHDLHLIEAAADEIEALRSVLRGLDVSVDDGEIAAFESIERPTPAQLDATLRALSRREDPS